MRFVRTAGCAALFVLSLGGCARESAPPPAAGTPPPQSPGSVGVAPAPVQRIDATPEAVARAEQELQLLAERSRRMHAVLSFEEFEKTVYLEPFPGGKYIVNGDTPIANRKQLREFYDKNVKPPQTPQLVVHQVGGLDAKWNEQQKRQLTYCVSNSFGSRQASVIQQMAGAAGEWEKAAAIDFVHASAQDASCNAANTNVVFDVRPVNVNGQYLARAFFPNEPRPARNVLIDQSSFDLPANETLQLAGILRHELGHTLGFRHEHTRPESGTCFENNDWRPLSGYDAFSVMHYPQCNGRGDWSLVLTDPDRHASACLYGPAQGFTINPSLVQGPCAVPPSVPPAGQPKTESFPGQSVARGAQRSYGPFTVAPGTPLEVRMGGSAATGDPDLYVRFGQPPVLRTYDCRPYLDGPAEVCSITVPANATRVFVMVRGYEQGTYDLQVTYTPPAATGRGGTNPVK
jgi:hypothetical protein